MKPDNAINLVFFDILERILKLSESPALFGDYLTLQIRELIGARNVVIAIRNDQEKAEIYSIFPKRKSDWINQPEMLEFARQCFSINRVTLLDINTSPFPIQSLLKAHQIEESIVIPLKIANQTIGVILLLDLMDRFGIESVVHLLEKLSGIFALIIRNALLYHNLEHTVAIRTQELMQRNLELLSKENELRIKNQEYEALTKELNEKIERINQVNLELEKARKKAEESDMLKSAFLANMSHEIRTPMNGILGFSERLADPDLSQYKRDQFAGIIKHCGNQLMSLINDLIDIAKIESNQLKIYKSKTHINTVIREIYSIFQSRIQESSVRLTFTLGLNDQACYVETDEVRLHQIINNLVSNAVKFTKEGEITFGYYPKDNVLEFFVEDTGIGISPDKQEFIFDRFRQAEENTAQTYGGSGLGLAISKALVHLLGGKIWVKSDLHAGATFYFTIPFVPVGSNVAETSPAESLNFYPSRNTVLVAEDDDINFLYMSEILEETSLQVIRAKNGREAVDCLRKHQNISLVLMDLKMPVMNGFEATAEIRVFNKEIPIIAQTAHAFPSDKDKVLTNGFTDYIAKPIQKNDLIGLLLKYILV